MIDECLSARLVGLAIAAGYEATHVARIGKGGTKDWTLAPFIVANDWTFVTRNAIDFRGPKSAVGTKGYHSRMPLHAGLICLNGPANFNARLHEELFRIALERLAARGDLVNMALEVSLEEADGKDVVVSLYPIPSDGPYSTEQRPFSETIRRLTEEPTAYTFLTGKLR